MKFLTDDFLLSTETARILYHNYAKDMPIIDYHCHIDPKDIYEDRRFENITQLWLGGDHYKWRIMRSNGVDERFITGDAPDKEKFLEFARTLPRCIGNPMYHWCHLELKNYFGYDGVLNEDTAEQVWDLTCEKMKDPSFSARWFISVSNVAMIGTTDDPVSDLRYHELIAESGFKTKVCPSFRPDPALNIHKEGFSQYIGKLSEASGIEINQASDVLKAISGRIDYFNAHGCVASDHGLDYIIYRPAEESEINAIFEKAMAGGKVTNEEKEAYQTYVLLHCAREYHRVGWAMQLHFSCLRNNNTKAFKTLGPDTGYDCMASTDNCRALCSLLDALEIDSKLPKTIIYSLNPADDAWIGTVLGAFQEKGIRGKIQHGSAWWFNDHKVGMTNQMVSLANLGILGNFIGMLTDSRSLASYARHEYFRRILCGIIGKWVEDGEYPGDIEYLGGLVRDICYNNAKEYFGL